MNINDFANSVMEGLSPSPDKIGQWQERSLFKGRIYGVFHTENTPVIHTLANLRIEPGKIAWLSFYGDEPAIETKGVEHIFVSNIDVLKSIMLSLHHVFPVLFVGPVSSIRDHNGASALEELHQWCLNEEINSTVIVYHSDKSLEVHSEPWRALIQYSEQILK